MVVNNLVKGMKRDFKTSMFVESFKHNFKTYLFPLSSDILFFVVMYIIYFLQNLIFGALIFGVGKSVDLNNVFYLMQNSQIALEKIQAVSAQLIIVMLLSFVLIYLLFVFVQYLRTQFLVTNNFKFKGFLKYLWYEFKLDLILLSAALLVLVLSLGIDSLGFNFVRILNLFVLFGGLIFIVQFGFFARIDYFSKNLGFKNVIKTFNAWSMFHFFLLGFIFIVLSNVFVGFFESGIGSFFAVLFIFAFLSWSRVYYLTYYGRVYGVKVNKKGKSLPKTKVISVKKKRSSVSKKAKKSLN